MDFQGGSWDLRRSWIRKDGKSGALHSGLSRRTQEGSSFQSGHHWVRVWTPGSWNWQGQDHSPTMTRTSMLDFLHFLLGFLQEEHVSQIYYLPAHCFVSYRWSGFPNQFLLTTLWMHCWKQLLKKNASHKVVNKNYPTANLDHPPQGFWDSPHIIGNALVRELRELKQTKGALYNM
jgi:hypothetical protein